MLRTITTAIFATATLSGCASYHADVEEATVDASGASSEGVAEDMANDASAEGLAEEEGQTNDTPNDDEGQGGGERVGG